jgi:hypothetical protein
MKDKEGRKAGWKEERQAGRQEGRTKGWKKERKEKRKDGRYL